MRVHVIFAHPVETSFSAAVHATILEGLNDAGHEIDDLDLYADGFDPILTRQGRLDYHDLARNQIGIEPYVERLISADALILSHPVWNYGWPAIMKGYFDRVWAPGVAFKLVDDTLRPNLQHLSSITTVTSYGGDRWRSWLMGDPPRKIGKRVMRALTDNQAKINYLALYAMDKSTDAKRAAFLQTVKHTMRNL